LRPGWKAEKGLTRLPSTEVTGSVFFYIDESGNSGNNLFDRQPVTGDDPS
jgi:hypothetical protein